MTRVYNFFTFMALTLLISQAHGLPAVSLTEVLTQTANEDLALIQPVVCRNNWVTTCGWRVVRQPYAGQVGEVPGGDFTPRRAHYFCTWQPASLSDSGYDYSVYKVEFWGKASSHSNRFLYAKNLAAVRAILNSSRCK